MINWENVRYDISNANKDFDKLVVNINEIEPINPPEEFEHLREQLIEARDSLYDEYNFDNANKLDYQFDVLFGLKLYDILRKDDDFSNRVAANDEIWRFLSIKVIPDIVHARWGMNASHFYQTSRRIWLKTIWWYIHLSWQNSIDETYKILIDNTTDTILQLVERPGLGYNVELFREIMKQYANYNDSSRNLFRTVLKLNTAKILTTSPELVDGGIEKYIDSLFKMAKVQ